MRKRLSLLVSLAVVSACAFSPAVSYAGWGEPEFIDFGWEYEARDPKLVMDDFGNAFCAFAARDPYTGIQNIYVNRYEGSCWGPPERLDPGDGLYCVEAAYWWDIDGNSGGDVVFVCNYRVNGVCGLYARHYTSGAWGDPVPIVTTEDEYLVLFSPGVAYCADGTALCTFLRSENGHNNLYASHFDGAAWSSPYFIAPDAGDSCHYYCRPRVAIDDATGNGICVFYRVVAGAFYTYASIYSGGVWSAASAIGPAGSVDGDLPEVPPNLAFGGAGNALCAFSVPGSSGEDPRAVYVNRFSGGNWEGGVRIDDGPDGQPWGYPDVAVGDGGDAICTLTRGYAWPAYARAYANVYTSGAGWGGPQKIGQELNGSGFSPCVGFDGFGGAVSVFIGKRHISCGGSIDAMHTCANYYSSGDWAGWEYFGGRGSLPYCLNCENADLAVDYYGNALCVYELTGSVQDSRIYAVRYTSGIPTATPTPTATRTPTRTATPRSTPTPDGVIRINYQPSDAPKPWIYSVDDGSPFGAHGEYEYGWR